MRVLVINPVGHATWDKQDEEIYRSFASPDTEVEVRSLPRGPKSVETAEAYAEVVPLVLEMIRENRERYDGFIVNCFLDPGVELAKAVTSKPVVGPCRSSITLASLVSDKVAVVTVGKEGLWLIKERIKQLGLNNFLIGVEGTSFGVLDIDKDRRRVVSELVERSIKLKEMGAEVIVLGCTGLAGMAKEVQREAKIPVIDPAGASIKVLEAILKLGL